MSVSDFWVEFKNILRDKIVYAVQLPVVVDSDYTHPYYTGLVTILIKAYGERIDDHTFELHERQRISDLLPTSENEDDIVSESFRDKVTTLGNFEFSVYRDLVNFLQEPKFRTLYDGSGGDMYQFASEGEWKSFIQDTLLTQCNRYYDWIANTRRLGEHSTRAQLLKYSSRILSIFFLEEVPKRVSKINNNTLGWANIEPSSVLSSLDGKSFIHHEIDFFVEEIDNNAENNAEEELVDTLWIMLREILHADVNMLRVLNDVFKRMDGTVIILSDTTSNPVRIKLSDSSDSDSSSGQTQWIVAVSVLGVVCVTLIILLVLSRR
jgi:hypothetical protein